MNARPPKNEPVAATMRPMTIGVTMPARFVQKLKMPLAMTAPVSRIMVNQPNVRGNAGSFDNGMPQTASLGCGTWGGNITSENLSVKHYMNTTWVSRVIPEDRPSEQELLGEFYGSEIF